MASETTPGQTLKKTLGIAGVGLIGGSIAAAARQRGLFDSVVGFGRSPERLQSAQDAGLLDAWSTDLAECRTVDLLAVCVPVSRIAGTIREAAEHLPAGALITDAGSVKGPLQAAIGSLPAAGPVYVPAHPLAGSEKQGHEHADPDLFEGRVCVICPPPDTVTATRVATASKVATAFKIETGAAADAAPDGAVEEVVRFWQSLGCSTILMDAERHDHCLARTSHLPHAVAAMVAAMLPVGSERLAATGFRDVTRIAAGDPRLWVDILLSNRDAVAESLAELGRLCDEARGAVLDADMSRIFKLLSAGQERRQAFERVFDCHSSAGPASGVD